MENAENTISEPLDFKIFWGRMPPDPPYKLTSPTLVCKPPHFNRGYAIPVLALALPSS